MKSHKDLDVWKKGIEFVVNVYELTKSFPKEEVYGISNQIRRAAVSIPSNIAEGAARKGKNEFKQFLYIALGSISELETQFIICSKVGYIEIDQFDKINLDLTEIRKMVLGLIKYLNT